MSERSSRKATARVAASKPVPKNAKKVTARKKRAAQPAAKSTASKKARAKGPATKSALPQKSVASSATARKSDAAKRKKAPASKRAQPSLAIQRNETTANGQATEKPRELPAEQCRIEESSPRYKLEKNELDPGWLLFVALQTEMIRQLDDASADLLMVLTCKLFEQIAGGPRGEVLPRTLLCFAGSGADAPATVSRDDVIVNQGGTCRAVCTADVPGWDLCEIETIVGSFDGLGDLDLTALLRDGNPELGAWNGHALRRLTVNLRSPGERSDDVVVLPGVAWSTPAALGCRVQAVRLHGAELAWRLDHAGRLVVPPQTAAGHQNAGGVRVEIDVDVRAGELRHAGAIIANCAEYDLHEHQPGAEHETVPAGSIQIPESGAAKYQVRQPFDSSMGVAGESHFDWLERAGRSVHHRQRAVTRQDFIDLVADRCADVDVVDVSPTLVTIGERDHDAVRVTIAPRHASSLIEFFERGMLAGNSLSAYLAPRCVEGVKVTAGPPTLLVGSTPQPSERLWLYRDFLVDREPSNATAHARADGTCWPVVRWSQLKGGPA